MNINTTNNQSINQIQSLQAIASEQSSQKNSELEKSTKTNEHEINISKAGQVSAYIDNLPEAEQQELKGYLQSIREAKSNGSFDIESSINNAPAEFNELVNKLNLNGEDVLDNMSEVLPKGKGAASFAIEGEKSPGISSYTDIAAQTTDNKDSSIFDKLASFFSSDTKEKANI
jgi:hypothetical protein